MSINVSYSAETNAAYFFTEFDVIEVGPTDCRYIKVTVTVTVYTVKFSRCKASLMPLSWYQIEQFWGI